MWDDKERTHPDGVEDDNRKGWEEGVTQERSKAKQNDFSCQIRMPMYM